MRQSKTIVIQTIAGKQIRIKKSEVADVQEQYVLGGGLDVVVEMKSGYQYITTMSKQQILERIRDVRQ